MPRRNSTKTLLNFLCQTPVRQLCLSILFLAVGKDFEEFSEVRIYSIINMRTILFKKLTLFLNTDADPFDNKILPIWNFHLHNNSLL